MMVHVTKFVLNRQQCHCLRNEENISSTFLKLNLIFQRLPVELHNLLSEGSIVLNTFAK